MAFARAPTKADREATTDFFLIVINTFSASKYLVSNRGTLFKNVEVENACEKLKIIQRFPTVYQL